MDAEQALEVPLVIKKKKKIKSLICSYMFLKKI